MTSTKRLCSVVSLSAVVLPGDEPAGAVLLACRHSSADPPQIARHRDTVAKCHQEAVLQLHTTRAKFHRLQAQGHDDCRKSQASSKIGRASCRERVCQYG